VRILDRYIGVAVIVGALTTLLVLVGLSGFFAFVGEMGDIGKGQYGLVEAIQYVLLTLPRRVYELFPMASLIGALLGLGAMAGHSELVVIRAAGVSLLRIGRSVLQAGLVLTLAAVVIGEFIAPPAEQEAENLRSLAQSDRITFKGRYGFWARDGSSYLNIQQILPGRRLSGVSIYELDEQHRLHTATRAETAVYEGDSWILEDVRQSIISPEGVRTKTFARASWDSLLEPDLLNVVVVKPESLAAWDLLTFIRYLETNGLDSGRYELAFWVKVVLPLSSLVMVLLSMPFVFGPLRSTGAGQRILVGVLIGISFYLINKTLTHLSLVYGYSPALSAAAPSLVFLAVAVYALHRVR